MRSRAFYPSFSRDKQVTEKILIREVKEGVRGLQRGKETNFKGSIVVSEFPWVFLRSWGLNFQDFEGNT